VKAGPAADRAVYREPVLGKPGEPSGL